MTDTIEETSTERLSACPLCGDASSKTLPVPGQWIGPEVFGDLEGKIGLVRCRGCGLVYINPRPSSDRLSAFYSGDTYTCHEATGSASAGAKADFILARIGQYLPPEAPHTLLDYGAGGGGFLTHARERGWKVRAFEPGKRGLESCRQSGLDATDRFEDLPQNEFGLVTLHHVFEHLANPTEVLERMRSLLTPGGRLYVEVPNVHSLRARLAIPHLHRWLRIDERHRAYPIHLMYYCDHTLRQMLEKSGWKVEATFNLGLGLDEFFIRPEAPRSSKPHAQKNGAVPPPAKRRFRHALRDAFLGMGIGENLAAIAYPAR